MLSQALAFLLDTFLGLFATALLLRFYLQVLRIPARNQITQFVLAVTDWIVLPVRRFVPGWAGLDLSTLLLAWLTQFVLLLAVAAIAGRFALPVAAFAALALIALLRTSLYILMGALILQAVLSWVAPHSPVIAAVNTFSRPFLRPLQKRIPPVGNVDLTPLLLLVALQLLLMLLVPTLEGLVFQLFVG